MGKLKIGFIPIEEGHYYPEALEEVVRAEELGFASVWMEEHHSVVPVRELRAEHGKRNESRSHSEQEGF